MPMPGSAKLAPTLGEREARSPVPLAEELEDKVMRDPALARAQAKLDRRLGVAGCEERDDGVSSPALAIAAAAEGGDGACCTEALPAYVESSSAEKKEAPLPKLLRLSSAK